MIGITFGDGFDWATVARAIPSGYTIALLDQGQEPPSGSAIVANVDFSLVGIRRDGNLIVRALDQDGEATGPEISRDFDSFDRIHVY